MTNENIPYVRGLWIFCGYLATRLIVVILCPAIVGRLFESSSENPLLVAAYASIFGEVVAAWVVWVLIRGYYELRTSDAGKHVLGIVSVSSIQVMLSVFAGFLLAASVSFLELRLPSRSATGSSMIDIYITSGASLRYSWLVAGIVVAPFVEELLFRGVVFSIISSHFNIIVGAIASVILFMLIHLPQVAHGWTSALAIFALGSTCALIRVQGMSLWMAVIVHASYNMYLTVWVTFHAYS